VSGARFGAFLVNVDRGLGKGLKAEPSKHLVQRWGGGEVFKAELSDLFLFANALI